MLSDDQRHALADHGEKPVSVVDPETQVTYVLLPIDQYQRVRPLFEVEEFSIRDSYPLQEAVARSAGWDDPALDAYNELAVPRRTP